MCVVGLLGRLVFFVLAETVGLVGAVGAVFRAVAKLLETDAAQVGHAKQLALRTVHSESRRIEARGAVELRVFDEITVSFGFGNPKREA